MIKQTSVQEINKLINGSGACQVIDVREYGEFEAVKIQQAKLVSLSNFERQIGEIDSSQPVYLMCRSGNRAKQAAEKLVRRGFSDVHVIEGGILAWSQAGFPTVKGVSKVWSLERQVRFAAGLLVLIGVVLAFAVHLFFALLSGFVGAGLVFAAITDTCGMAMMLARMPWNKEKQIICDTATR